MNTKICTSIEQSKKLLSLGLDQDTADMVWRNENIDTFIHYSNPFLLEEFEFCDLEKDVPCWSLSALLELEPFFILIKEEGEPDEYYHFQLKRDGSVFHSTWRASYYGLKNERGKVRNRRIPWAVGPKENQTPLDAAFEMVCWLIEQGYIKVKSKNYDTRK